MTPTLVRHLGGRFLAIATGTVLLLAALVLILDLLDTAEDILAMHKGAGGFAYYIVMRLPSIVPEVLPLGVLLAALFMFASLMRHSELIAMRAAGISIAQMLIAILPAVTLIALVHYGLSDTLRPNAERRLAQWWNENEERAAEKPVWLKVDDTIVEVGRVREGGRRLENVKIYRRDANDAVSFVTVADRASYDNRRWALQDATLADWRRGEISTPRPADGDWQTRLRPRDVVAAMTPDANISAGTAYEALVGKRLAIAAPSVYATALQRAFSQPASDFVMLLLAAPLAFANWRSGSGGRVFLLSLGAGLLFILTDGVVATLGRSGLLHPVPAAWGPTVLFALLALAALHRLQGTGRARKVS
ncbi:LptF/LptG family permease [Aureimonas psammosilenae]|uniref:LptF/LptG family permease n=1 Tax=Aureimonas psammosilenae TaxID=2495496 RepID=UPI0012604722|nr:LptF/LptG family permease [Aureimonas psammosilenae]